jgi:hypothetical protein
MDIALDDHRVEHRADIVDCGVGNEIQLAGIRIDLDLCDVTFAGKGEIHRIEEGGRLCQVYFLSTRNGCVLGRDRPAFGT